MAKYTVKEPLNHNNKPFKIGATIDLDEDDAAPLLACNPPVIELPAEKKKEKEDK